MAATVRTVLSLPGAPRAPQAAQLLAQLEDLHRRLRESTAGMEPDELEWQLAPGVNTIGMLLAHIAYAETHLGQVGVLGETTGHAHDVIGIREEDEGMPLPADGRPSPALAGRDLAFFTQALDRALEHSRRVIGALADADLDREIVRRRPDGTTRVFDVRWAIHHMVEHFAGHYGQILLLRHLHRDAVARRGA